MIIAFRRADATGHTSAIADPDGDWDDLKIRMCNQWGIEGPFNSRNIWRRLRLEHIVLYNGHLYQVWDTRHQGEIVELFEGHLVVDTFDVDPDVD